MNSTAGDHDRTRLDSFETALLAELKTHIAERSGDEHGSGVLGRAPTIRQAGVLAAAACAVLIALTVVTTTGHPTPAYAVSPRNNGGVVVTVTRLEGAHRLEEALREHGVAADITYLEWGQQCAPDRYREIPTPGLTLGASTEEFTVEIPPDAVGRDDTFVLSAAVRPLRDGGQYHVSFGITSDDPVAPCRIIDA